MRPTLRLVFGLFVRRRVIANQLRGSVRVPVRQSLCVATAFATHKRHTVAALQTRLQRTGGKVAASRSCLRRTGGKVAASRTHLRRKNAVSQQRLQRKNAALQQRLQRKLICPQRKPTEINGNQSSAGNFGECLDRSSQHRSVRIYKTIYFN